LIDLSLGGYSNKEKILTRMASKSQPDLLIFYDECFVNLTWFLWNIKR